MQYLCPNCQTPLQWRQDNVFRPFCSERCQNHDLIAWANEENRIAGDSQFDDILSHDLDSDYQ